MKLVSIKELVPLAISGLAAVSIPGVQTFNYNDIAQNSIQLTDFAAISHLKIAQETNYGAHIYRFRFYKAYHKWAERINFLSSPSQVVNDSNFQEIVKMGFVAVPFIIEELEKEPSYLVWALNQIFGFKISDSPYTTIPEARKIWLKYLKSL